MAQALIFLGKKKHFIIISVMQILMMLLVLSQSTQAQPDPSRRNLDQYYNSQNLVNTSDRQPTNSLNSFRPVKIISPVDASRNRGKPENSIFNNAYPGFRTPDNRSIESQESSPLELDYQERTQTHIKQFGYNLMSQSNTGSLTGSLGEDYVLGIGDELIVSLFGQSSQTVTTKIDTEGRLFIPNFPPLSAAGRRFGDFRSDLKNQIKKAQLGTEVYVSIGKVRSISVTVLGEVEYPGIIQTTSLSSILDVLSAAGGIKKSGSLRNIRIIRGSEQVVFDAYNLFDSTKVDSIPRIKQGDRIVVPLLGETIAVTGEVKRPGIYELKHRSASVQWALNQAGGTIRALGNRVMLAQHTQSGRDQFSKVSRSYKKTTISNGDFLIVQKIDGSNYGSFTLEGHVRQPGLRTLDQYPTVKKLLSTTNILKDDPYLLFVVIDRIDPETRVRSMVAENLFSILNSNHDFNLQNEDKVLVLGRQDVMFLRSDKVSDILYRRNHSESKLENIANLSNRSSLQGQQTEDLRTIKTKTPSKSCPGLQQLAQVLGSESTTRFSNALSALDEGYGSVISDDIDCPDLYKKYPKLLPFLLEHVVAVTGAVRQPGAYPIAGATPLDLLLRTSGGKTKDASTGSIEVSRSLRLSSENHFKKRRYQVDTTETQKWTTQPGDIIHVFPAPHDFESGPVLLAGEFLQPGFYNITRGESLSSLISRAGGLTDQAYPYGAVFTRERLKTSEKAWLERRYQELQETIVAASTRASRRNSTASGGMVDALKLVAGSLLAVKPVGRMVVEADPAILEVHPEKDVVLQPGDRLYMPKRPSHIRVEGEVLNPGAIAFNSGSKAEEYIRDAGGLKHAADDERTFIVFPDGRAQPLHISSWNYSETQVPPGSTIFVPRDPIPFDGLGFTIDITDILSKIAITAASIATINR